MPVKLASAVLLAASLFGAEAALAQGVDLSTMKCKDFIELPRDTVNAVTLWLDGYFTDEEDPAVVDLDKMKVKAEKLGAYCVQNPNSGLMSAAESVMAK
jgi:acid stress chaperone HdeB